MSDKAARGTKRTCSSCNSRFYDLNRDPITCPSCEAVFVVPEAEAQENARVEAAEKAKIARNEAAKAAKARAVDADTDDDDIDDDLADIETDDDDVGADDDDVFLEDDEDDSADVSTLVESPISPDDES